MRRSPNYSLVMSVHVEQKFSDPLFAVSFSPVQQVYTTGLSNGTVSTYRLEADAQTFQPHQVWTTRRHKGSCRALIYDHSGEYIFSAGNEGIIKKAHTESGKVCAKFNGGIDEQEDDGAERGITCLNMSESWLACGDDSGAFSIFDWRMLKIAHRYEQVHDDCITSIVSGIPGKNKYHYITTGATTLCDIDIRKGIVQTSEDQEDEILCGAVAGSQRLAFGMSQGVVTLWDPRHLDDQLTRVKISENNTVDCLIAGENDDTIVVGCSDGFVREIDTRATRVLRTFAHSEANDEITMLDYDSEYRLVTANMELLKIWKKDDELTEEDLDQQAKRKRSETLHQMSKKKQKQAKKKQDIAKSVGIKSFGDL